MRSIDELRGLAADINCNEIIDHVSQFYVSGEVRNTFDGAWLDSWHGAFDRALEAVEREVSENYMLLPVDADGVPIHMGDTVEGELIFDDATAKGTVTTYRIHDNDEPDTVYIKVDCGNGTWTIKELRIKRCHHVKPRTLEDVLVDMLEAAVGYSDAHTDVSLVAVEKYADEIREMMEVDDAS